MVIVPIRGLHFYEAERLYAQGGLTAGLRVTLVRDLSNAFDHHAVQVRLTTTRALLGHIPREHSQLFSAAIDGKTILDAVIMDVEKSGKYLTAKIRVTHREVSKSSFSPAAAPKTDLRHYARTDRGAQSAVVNKKNLVAIARRSTSLFFQLVRVCIASKTLTMVAHTLVLQKIFGNALLHISESWPTEPIIIKN